MKFNIVQPYDFSFVCVQLSHVKNPKFSCFTLRLFEVGSIDYMMSICGNDALKELSLSVRSGSFFYLTDDDSYMVNSNKEKT